MATAGSGMSALEYEAQVLREKAILQLDKNIKVTSQRKSPSISIVCTGATPRLAQEIVEAVMNRVLRTYLSMHAVKRSRGHYDRELSQKERDLKRYHQALEAFATTHGFLSVDHARETLNGVIDRLENDLVDTSLNLQQSLAMVRELQKQSESVEEEFELPRMGMEKQATAGAQSQLYDRIAEKARLMARYSKDHPRINEINAEIDRLREDVGELPEQRIELTKVRNPVYEQLKIALLRESASAEALSQRHSRVLETLSEKRERLSELNRLKTESYRLQRQIDLAQDAFDIYARKRNEAQMADQLDREDISDLVIQQPASLVLTPVNPQGRVILPLGFVLAITGGATDCDARGP